MSNRYAGPNLTAITTPSKIVNWIDPPDTADVQHRTRSTYQGVVAELVRHPGRWARLADRSSRSGAYQFAKSVAAGRASAFRPEGAFESAWEGTAVWVRYIGDPDDQDAEPFTPPDDEEGKEAPAPEYTETPDGVKRPDPERLFSF